MLSNEFGRALLVIDAITVSDGGSGPVVPVLSQGAQRWEIPPGATATSDPLPLSGLALNRVTGSENPSEILGQLTANGQVWLVNSSGVFFGPNAQVNVAGLVVHRRRWPRDV